MAGEEAGRERQRNKTEQQAVSVTCRNINVGTTHPVSGSTSRAGKSSSDGRKCLMYYFRYRSDLTTQTRRQRPIVDTLHSPEHETGGGEMTFYVKVLIDN